MFQNVRKHLGESLEKCQGGISGRMSGMNCQGREISGGGEVGGCPDSMHAGLQVSTGSGYDLFLTPVWFTDRHTDQLLTSRGRGGAKIVVS